MMPPSSHNIKQPMQRTLMNVTPINQISSGSNIDRSVCNGQNISSPHTSSFAAALRKLAKKAVDPVLDNDGSSITESTQGNIHRKWHSDNSGASPMLSKGSPSHYKRPNIPPLIQSRQVTSECSAVPTDMSSSSNSHLVYNNSSMGLDFSKNRDSSLLINHSPKKILNNPSIEPMSYLSPGDFSQASPIQAQMRSTSSSMEKSINQPLASLKSSANNIRLKSYHQQNSATSQAKLSSLPVSTSAFDVQNISTPFSPIHASFYSPTVPSSAYRYNSEPLYVEPYSSLLRPSFHPNIMLQSPSHRFPSSAHLSSTYAGQYNTSDYAIYPKTTSSSPVPLNIERNRNNSLLTKGIDISIRPSEEVAYDLKISNEKEKNLIEPCGSLDYSQAAENRSYKSNPHGDQNFPINLLKTVPEAKTDSEEGVIRSGLAKTTNSFPHKPILSQLPKERYKHLQSQKAFQTQDNEKSEFQPNDLSVKKTEPQLSSMKSYDNSVISMCRPQPVSVKTSVIDYWKSKSLLLPQSSIQTSHCLPVRQIEAPRVVVESVVQHESGDRLSSDKVCRGKRMSLLSSREIVEKQNQISRPNNSEQDVQKKIFNPAFHNNLNIPSVSKNESNLMPSNFKSVSSLSQNVVINKEHMPALISKLDREWKRLQEFRRYNQFSGSDQSDDDMTDVDENEFNYHESVRNYHLMTITSGPPMKLNKSEEKLKFLRMFGLTTHRCRSGLELKKYVRRRKNINREVFPKVDILVKKKLNEILKKVKTDNVSDSINGDTLDSCIISTKKIVNSPMKEKFLQQFQLAFNDSKKTEVVLKRESFKTNVDIPQKIEEDNDVLNEESVNSSLNNSDISDKSESSLRRKRNHDDDDVCDSMTETSAGDLMSPKLIALDHSSNESTSDLETDNDPKQVAEEFGSKLYEDFVKHEKILGPEFAQEFHNSVLQTTQDQQAMKLAGATNRTRSIGCTQVDESSVSEVSHQSEFVSQNGHLPSTPKSSKATASSTSNNFEFEEEPSTTHRVPSAVHPLPSSLLTPPNQIFKWPGIQAVMEAYERHYDLQKLEKDILSSQCQCLKLKNKELANLADKLRSRMCDLITSKRQLDNERQQRQYAIDNLKKTIKNIR